MNFHSSFFTNCRQPVISSYQLQTTNYKLLTTNY